MIDKNKVAVLMLACRDYEALEVSLACHLEFGDPGVTIYLLQNCFGNYDSQRTLQVAQRYAKLYPGRLEIFDQFGECSPYVNIRKVIDTPTFASYSHIIKVDDDAFPVRSGWVDDLIRCWDEAEARHGEDLAYVTPLINNNCWGFKQVIDGLDLGAEYYDKVARQHRIGSGDMMNPFQTLPATEIYTGANGTIWASPHVARWLHEKTTFQPDFYVEATRDLGAAYVDEKERYSIGAILFRKDLWNSIGVDGENSTDDEHLLHMYCRKHGKKIVCQQSVPFVHLAYFSQRAENRDIVPRAREIYQAFTGVNYPIGLVADRQLEIEARLRWIENEGRIRAQGNLGPAPPIQQDSSLTRSRKRIKKQAKRMLAALGGGKRQ